MGYVLTLEIPDPLYQALAKFAEKQGRSVEDLGVAWLSATIDSIANDPLMKLAGTFHSGVPDLAERHDYYIGQHLMQELRDEEG